MVYNNLDWKWTSDASSASSHWRWVGFKVRGDSPKHFPAVFEYLQGWCFSCFISSWLPFLPAGSWYSWFPRQEFIDVWPGTETLGTLVWTNLGVRIETVYTPECYWASLIFFSPKVTKPSTDTQTIDTDCCLPSHGSPWKAFPFHSLFP